MRVAELNLAQAIEEEAARLQKGTKLEKEALMQLARQVEEAQELSDAAALAAGANDELIEAVATAVHLGGSAEDLDDADIIAQSEAGSSVRIPEPETKKEAGEPGAWLPPETAGIVEPGFRRCHRRSANRDTLQRRTDGARDADWRIRTQGRHGT